MDKVQDRGRLPGLRGLQSPADVFAIGAAYVACVGVMLGLVAVTGFNGGMPL